MRHFVRAIGQRLVVVFERGVGVERQVELVDPAEVEVGAAQRVGWLERSEIHQIRARPNDGFRSGSTHPTALITRCRVLACTEDRTADKRCCKMDHRTAGNSRW
jgi:hypothetical protein